MSIHKTQDTNANTQTNKSNSRGYNYDPEEAIKKRFLEIDKNNDGELTKEEYKSWQRMIYQKIGYDVPEEQLNGQTETLWRAAHSTGDSLSFAEFKDAFPIDKENSSYTSLMKSAGIQMIFSQAKIKIDTITSEKEFRDELAKALKEVTSKRSTPDRLKALNKLIDDLESGNIHPGYQGDGKTQYQYITSWWKSAGGAIIPPTD